MSAPYSYNQINNYNAHYSPSTVHCQNTDLVNFYKRYLLEKVQAVFEWSLPPGWNRDYFERVLYCNGYISIINTDKFGVIPQKCGLYGYDVFYQPTNVTIANPLLSGILRPRIGTQCALIKMQPDYKGVVDIISYYADLRFVRMQHQLTYKIARLQPYLQHPTRPRRKAIKRCMISLRQETPLASLISR